MRRRPGVDSSHRGFRNGVLVSVRDFDWGFGKEHEAQHCIAGKLQAQDSDLKPEIQGREFQRLFTALLLFQKGGEPHVHSLFSKPAPHEATAVPLTLCVACLLPTHLLGPSPLRLAMAVDHIFLHPPLSWPLRAISRIS